MNKGKIFCLVGPSCVGKTTIVNAIVKKFPYEFREVISTTTRDIRDGEVDGQHYHFVSKEEFARLEKEDRFVQTANNFGESYGIQVGDLMGVGVEASAIPLAVVTRKGVVDFIKYLNRDKVVTILLKSDPDHLKQQLYDREKTFQGFLKRNSTAEMEMCVHSFESFNQYLGETIIDHVVHVQRDYTKIDRENWFDYQQQLRRNTNKAIFDVLSIIAKELSDTVKR